MTPTEGQGDREREQVLQALGPAREQSLVRQIEALQPGDNMTQRERRAPAWTQKDQTRKDRAERDRRRQG